MYTCSPCGTLRILPTAKSHLSRNCISVASATDSIDVFASRFRKRGRETAVYTSRNAVNFDYPRVFLFRRKLNSAIARDYKSIKVYYCPRGKLNSLIVDITKSWKHLHRYAFNFLKVQALFNLALFLFLSIEFPFLNFTINSRFTFLFSNIANA